MSKFFVRLFSLLILLFIVNLFFPAKQKTEISITEVKAEYWILLKRKSNLEHLYYGVPGKINTSTLVKQFKVKTGIPGKKPTPLPSLLNKSYWLIIDKYETQNNEETAPYFLKLNIPISTKPPYGPSPYLECNGQCNWEVPGPFGLHGVNNDPSKLSTSNPGSSGCIRHTNKDIIYLYKLLKPKENKVRYYIVDK
jgi:lipoprotein-anchoring transpeptidase ErfK/SrfK